LQHDPSSRDLPCEWVRALLSDEHDLAAIAVEQGYVANANASAATLFRRPVVGAELRELFDPGSWGKLEAALAAGGSCELQVACDERGEPHVARFLVLCSADGRRMLVTASSGAMSYSEEQGRELMRLNDELGLLTRELSRRAQDLARARDQLERLDALRQHFMAMLAHDLKAPLCAVRLVGQALARGAEEPGSDAVRVMGQRLNRAALRMTGLIDTVLAAAKLENEEIALSVKPTSLESLARDAIDALEPIAHERHVVIACDAAGDTTAPVDAAWMEQVVANLLANALRYAPEGSAITVSILGDDARVRCAVADRGPGVPPDLRGVIFERFRQAGPRAGSAGLGLYVARRLVDMHGGRIWVEEAEGGGARFWLEVPKAARAGA
jgi:two-component system sensor histidine kinase BaeS